MPLAILKNFECNLGMESSRENTSALEQDCAKEPIHIPGSIQSHGILLALRASDLTILQVSESIVDLLALQPSELLHQPLSVLMDVRPVVEASKKLGERLPRLLNPIPIEMEIGGKGFKFDGILHRSGRVLILELERHVPDKDGYGGFGGFYEVIREVTTKIMVTESLNEVFDLTCNEVRKLTDFSRVLIYKFDDEWNGTVIAESSDGKFESLMSHRFPASDIPKQARDLYTTNWLRLVPDVDFSPSPLIPQLNPLTDQPLDLSNSALRSVSPVHVQYMKNLGQGASMSVSLLKGRKLWGLISCHHKSPVFLKYGNRVACEFIGQMVSAQIGARTETMENDHRLQLKALYDDLIITGAHYTDLAATFAENASSTLALTDARGAAICLDETPVLIGKTPDATGVKAIRKWFMQQNEDVLAVSNLEKAWPEGAQFRKTASGVLGIKIPKNKDACLFWFRPEQSEGIKWGGNPNESKSLSPDGRLQPRTSFATWLENVGNQALEWNPSEINAAKELRTSILAMALRSPGGQQRFDEAFEFRRSLAVAIEDRDSHRHDRVPEERPGDRAENRNLMAAQAIDAYPDLALVVLDDKGRLEYWSVGARNLFGYETTEAVGQSLDFLFSDDVALKDKHERLINYVREHRRCEEQLWLFRKDARSFWGKIMVTKLEGTNGELIGFSVILQDITKEKAAEEDLKATRFAAEAANQAKTAFLANISHEIRTPLGALLGFSNLMNQTGLSDEDRASLYERVSRNGLQLTNLINDLLDMAKVEAGKIIIEKLAFDLPNLLLDLEQTMSIKAAERSISFKVIIGSALPLGIVTDPTRLRQILVNLLSNAIKFTQPSGSVLLSCRAERGTLQFRVIDSGKGISEEEAGRLFKPFAQADSTVTRTHGGTGLGLFVSRRLAKALGGELSIEKTEVGKGSTFLLEIEPETVAGSNTFSALRLEKKPAARKVEKPGVLQGVNILVVDDSPDNRDLICIYLNNAGAAAKTAENGEEAVEFAMRENFDLILMDIQMPKKDGNKAMAELVNLGYRKPVIALTAHAMADERKYSLAHGFVDYLTKPIDKELLIGRIASLTK